MDWEEVLDPGEDVDQESEEAREARNWAPLWNIHTIPNALPARIREQGRPSTSQLKSRRFPGFILTSQSLGFAPGNRDQTQGSRADAPSCAA